VATVANETASANSAYSVRALRVGQYARYKHWRRSLLDGRAVAGPISGPPTLDVAYGIASADNERAFKIGQYLRL